jgi:hypothetical protein
MNTRNNSTQQRYDAVEGAADAIDLNQLQVGDQLLLWTQNSFYQFLIKSTAPTNGRLARGGVPVSAGAAVTLVGASEQRQGQAPEALLKTGRHAVFLVPEEDDDPRQLVTSAITKLNRIQLAKQGTDFFSSETWGDDAGLEPLPFGREHPHDTVDFAVISSGNKVR